MSDDALLEEARRRGLAPAEDPLIAEARRRGIVAPAVPVEGRNPAAQAVLTDQNRAPEHTLGEKFSMGAGDIPRGLLQGAVRLAPVFNPGDENTQQMSADAAKSVDTDIAAREAKWQDERKRAMDEEGNKDTGTEYARAAGGAVAAAPFAALLPEAGAGAGFGRMIGTNALQGGAMAALAPVEDTSKGYANAKGAQVAEGAGLGGVTGGLLSGAGRIISPQTDPNVRMLMDHGVTPTPGQTLGKNAASFEEKLSSVPLMGDAIKMGQRRAIDDYNKAVYNEVLSPLKMTYDGPIGHAGIKQVGDKISEQYDKLLPNLNFTMDPQFATDMQRVNGLAQNLTPDAQKQFVKIMNNEVGSRLQKGIGTIDGDAFKQLESVLSGYQKTFAQGNANDKLVGDAISEVVDSLRSGLDRSNPKYIGQLADINDSWRRLVVLERAATNSTKNEGVFTPEVLLNAVKAEEGTARKRGVGRGTGTMQDLANAGNQVLGRSYPDSGTAGRAMAGGALLSGGSGMAINPTVGAAAGLGMLAYTPMGQRAANALFARRPRQAPAIADTLRRVGGPAATAGLIFGQNGGQ